MKGLNKWLAAAVIGTAGIANSTYAQTAYEDFLARTEVQQFNTNVFTELTTGPLSDTLIHGKPAIEVSIDLDALFSLDDFQIELPSLENIHVLKDHVTANRLGGFTWVGDVVYVDPTGFGTGIQGRAYFVESATGVTGTIHTPDAVIQIFSDADGNQRVITSDHSEFHREGEAASGDAEHVHDEVAAGPSIGGRIDGQSPATMENPYTIDVLWVVTQRAMDAANGDMEAMIELATENANDTYRNSGIPGRIRIVGVHYDTAYAESENMPDTLYDVTNTSDGNLDDIPGLRVEYGADLVAVVSGATNWCGYAWIDSSYNYGYSVTGYNCLNYYTAAHEFGHNFGAQHDVANANSSSNYEFSYGWYNESADPRWRTVMSYQCPAGNCGVIPYFSTPEQTYNGAPLGFAETHDNTRVHRVRLAEIAGFNPAAPACTDHIATNGQHESAGRAFTRVEGQTCWGSFCWGGTTTYLAVGSEDSLGTNAGTTTNLAEQPTGFFTNALCSDLAPIEVETPFAPELQNLNPSVGTDTFVISGEVFDANADTITVVNARISGETTWSVGTVNSNSFSVSISTTLTSPQVTVEFRTEDNTGQPFEFSTTFEVDVGIAPTLDFDSSNFRDDTAVIYGRSIDPDNSVTDLFYQVGGSGNPEVGTWTNFPVDRNFWELIVPGLPVGTSTINIYGVDETGLQSPVISTDVTILPLEAPECNFIGASASITQTPGQIELNGLVSDVNRSDVTVEYQINGGAWTAFAEYEMINSVQTWTVRLPDIFDEGSVLNISTRASDSTGLSSDCGSDIYTVTYPTENVAPSCEIIDIERIEASIVFRMFVSDPNGNPQTIFGRAIPDSEWIQFFPSVISRNGLPIPGVGDFTVEGRVVDTEGLEGFCSADITITDTFSAPTIDFVDGRYETTADTVLLRTRVSDWDGDITSVEARPVGGTWAGLTQDDIWGNYSIDLGLLPNGDYSYEVRATDAGGRVSEISTVDFSVERQVAPVLQNITWSQNGTTITVSGEAIDANNNMRRVYFELDGGNPVYINVTGSTWSEVFEELSLGTHTLIITAEDTQGMQSEPVTLVFEVSTGSAPEFTNINVSIVNETSARLDASGSDADDDLETLYVSLDGAASIAYQNTGFDTWIIEYPNQSVGTHTLAIYLEDSFGNTSPIETRTFEIEEPSTPCFEDSNSNHVSAGRATTRTEGQTCFGSFCFGGTTTYFANGSDDNMGTSSSAITSLLETSPGYFVIGVCNDTIAPSISLNGDNPMTVYQGQTFVDPGATATDNIDGSFAVTDITGSVDTSIIGSYQLTYNAVDSSGNTATPIVRTVNVVADDVIPVITIPGGTSYTVTIGNSFNNPAANAIDNVDGNISANVVVTGSVNTDTLGTYYLYYNVSDSAGNAADEVVVTVEVVEEQDVTPPVITLTGAPEMTIDLNSTFSEPGYSAVDDNDGDITANVVVAGDAVDTSREGTYVITYNVSDASENAAQQRTRTVNVIDPNGSACFTSTLSEHVTAGRSYEQYFSYYATGTATYLGSTFNNSNTVVSLEETSSGNWTRVDACD